VHQTLFRRDGVAARIVLPDLPHFLPPLLLPLLVSVQQRLLLVHVVVVMLVLVVSVLLLVRVLVLLMVVMLVMLVLVVSVLLRVLALRLLPTAPQLRVGGMHRWAGVIEGFHLSRCLPRASLWASFPPRLRAGGMQRWPAAIEGFHLSRCLPRASLWASFPPRLRAGGMQRWPAAIEGFHLSRCLPRASLWASFLLHWHHLCHHSHLTCASHQHLAWVRHSQGATTTTKRMMTALSLCAKRRCTYVQIRDRASVREGLRGGLSDSTCEA
jgi:hypothetical protein